MESSGENTSVANAQQPAAIQPLPASKELDMERMELLTRFLVGALAEGGVQLLARLREYQDKIAELKAEEPVEPDLAEASRSDLMRYLAVGSAVRTQRGAVRAVHGGASIALKTSRSVFGALNWVTNNPLGRPLRWPVESMVDRLREEINESVVVGHGELVEGRILARETTLDIIDDFVAYLSDNPELAELVSDQIGQQSLSMASSVAKTSRTITEAADNSVEGVIRRLLGLPARKEMASSPFSGNPDAVYHPGISPLKNDSTANE
jgi:hypothetical protein